MWVWAWNRVVCGCTWHFMLESCVLHDVSAKTRKEEAFGLLKYVCAQVNDATFSNYMCIYKKTSFGL